MKKLWFAITILALLMMMGGSALAGAGKSGAMKSPGPSQPYYHSGPKVGETEPNDNCGTANGPFAPGVAVEGEITPNDVDWFAFELPADQIVMVTLHETPGQPTVDTILALFDPTCATELAFNDDGGVGLYSNLAYYPFNLGTYYIGVQGYDAVEEGFYTLTVEIVPFAENDMCAGAIDLHVQHMQQFEVNTCGGFNDYDPGGGCIGWPLLGPDIAYVINVPGGVDFTVTLDTGYDAAMYLVTDCGDVVNSCLVGADGWFGDHPEELTYMSAGPMTYFLILDAEAECGPAIITITSPVAREAQSWGMVKTLYR